MKDLISLIEEGFDNPQDNVITYDGSDHIYAVINTIEWDEGRAGTSIMVVTQRKLKSDAGFDDAEVKQIKKLKIGEAKNDFNDAGVVVVKMQ